MGLPLADRLAMLLPPPWYYGRRIAYETRTGEPELAALSRLIGRRGTVIDVGANQGFYAYALAAVADRVLAFEPNPDYARFARRMLRGRAEVCAMALSDKPGRGIFHVPLADDGMVLHLAGSLKRTHSQFFQRELTYEVEIRTLDGLGPDFGVSDVRFIKADVEGSEREVLDGARATIARDRRSSCWSFPSGTHQTRAATRRRSAKSSATTPSSSSTARPSRRCRRLRRSARIPAGGTAIETRNVLFRPR